MISDFAFVTEIKQRYVTQINGQIYWWIASITSFFSNWMCIIYFNSKNRTKNTIKYWSIYIMSNDCFLELKLKKNHFHYRRWIILRWHLHIFKAKDFILESIYIFANLCHYSVNIYKYSELKRLNPKLIKAL